ncbi:hypothetical protein LX32DRAFT_391824 [Colletotrichum zoysiae]|uniref:Uncharacterized protein n=1 Tax=Colletotrichum zoysiae TaxID=1216348 RepID=A0AAD9HGR2_9PEZI|nr:hypothetical protein LX32DRAFT_391824 [Colletotrichum zoysiae]
MSTRMIQNSKLIPTRLDRGWVWPPERQTLEPYKRQIVGKSVTQSTKEGDNCFFYSDSKPNPAELHRHAFHRFSDSQRTGPQSGTTRPPQFIKGARPQGYLADTLVVLVQANTYQGTLVTQTTFSGIGWERNGGQPRSTRPSYAIVTLFNASDPKFGVRVSCRFRCL